MNNAALCDGYGEENSEPNDNNANKGEPKGEEIGQIVIKTMENEQKERESGKNLSNNANSTEKVFIFAENARV